MAFHPTLIILFFTTTLLFVGKNKKIFNLISLSFPIICWLLLMLSHGTHYYKLYNLKIIWDYEEVNKLIGSAFLLVIFAFNAYSISQKKFKEIIFGSMNGAFAFISLLAKDFISVFIGLELMVVISSIIIFIGGKKNSPSAARKYFLTHLVSSSMILIGFTHIISTSNSSEFVLITDLINNSTTYSITLLYIMFIGIVINIAAFPFSGWMVNYYDQASPSGFLYLISFTTKISVILLIKLFSGFEHLKYVALSMILYGGFKAILENNILKLLCYLSITSMGVMVLGISAGEKVALLGVVYYLFTHIIYKSILSLSAATLIDSYKITLCSEIGRLKNKILIIALSLGIALMVNLPFTLSFYGKLEIARPFKDNIFYILILLANLLSIISIPWKKSVKSEIIMDVAANFFHKLSLFSIIIPSCLIVFGPFLLLVILRTTHEVSTYSIEIFKQIGISIIAIIIILSLNYSRKTGKALNLIETFGNIGSYFYKYWQNKGRNNSPSESWNLNSLEEQIILKFSSQHNQQSAIFLVFLFIIILLNILYWK